MRFLLLSDTHGKLGTINELAARFLADCFKFRSVVGLDVAIEALRDCLREKRATVDELVHFGKICRVDRVMRPYLEALV